IPDPLFRTIRAGTRRGYTGFAPGQELPKQGWTRGLREVRVESRLLCFLFIPLLAEAGYCHQHHLVAARLPDAPAGFIAVQPRHPDVEQHDVWTILLHLEQAALPVVSASAVAAELLDQH